MADSPKLLATNFVSICHHYRVFQQLAADVILDNISTHLYLSVSFYISVDSFLLRISLKEVTETRTPNHPLYKKQLQACTETHYFKLILLSFKANY